MLKRFMAACLAALIVVWSGPITAFADDASSDEGITVSSDGNGAVTESAGFGIDSFTRARAGSDRPINDVYEGYAFLAGSTSDNLTVIATEADVFVYVPQSVAENLGVDVSDASDQAALKSLVTTLDVANARGGSAVSDSLAWHFTSDQVYTYNGLKLSFDQEYAEGKYYASIIGEDGSDVTDDANPLYAKPTHADFAKLDAASSTAIASEPSFVDSAVAFLSHIDYSPLWVTLKTSCTTIVIVFVLGLAAAYFSIRISPHAQDVADAIFTIPMVLPPTVCGFLLLLLLGRNTALGQWFIDIGFPLIFSWPATVIAATVVSFPLMYRSARGAFEGLDTNMLDAARTLGWSNGRIFFRIMLPLTWSSIASGTVLAFSRALGEFGATLFLAGNYLGITRTIPIAIYFEWMNGNTDLALFWTAVIMVVSFLAILLINLWSRRTTSYRKGSAES